jgi:two-component system response regulator RstA
MTTRLVFAEDDTALAGLLKDYLERHDFQVTVVHDGAHVMEVVQQEAPDAVLLDIMLPNVDGLTLCQNLRTWYQKPIILFTANDSEIKHILGLELGANDYIVKTTSPSILLARLHSQLRQYQPTQSTTVPSNSLIRIGQLTIDKTNRTVLIGSDNINLSSSDFDMLWLLACHAGEILTRDQLLRATRNIDYDGLDRSIDIAISRLRKKLLDDADEPARIKTIRNKGYLLSPSGWN